MNTHAIQKRKWSAKLVALVLAVAVVVTALLVGLGSTLAAPTPITVNLQNETGIGDGYTIEVNQTKIYSVTSMYQAYSADPSIATATYVRGGSANNLTVRGVKAGVTAVAYGNKNGVLSIINYLITDSNNISSYVINNNGEVYFSGPNFSKSAPITVPSGSGNYNTISWSSMNTAIATVDSNGTITSKGIGATVVIGSFIDKWGIKRDLHVMVGVGVRLSNTDLSELLELIRRAEDILANDSDAYTADSLAPLGPAKDAGKNVVDSANPTDSQIQTAITNLRNAINGLVRKTGGGGGGVIGPDPGGNYYKPVGDPEKVYEIVNQDGSSKYQPPRYVWNPTGDPVGNWQQNRPAYPYSGGYWVEDPVGSNIYKRVNSNGTLRDSPARWGGPDLQFGTNDDMDATKFSDGAYWVHMGQNVWRKVTGPTTLGPLTGGGPNEDPAATPGLPVYLHSDGKYYIGPLGPDSDDNMYYYGDSITNGDGKLNSTAQTKHYTDDKFYLVNGQMTTTPPNKTPNWNVDPGETIVIDGIEWIKIRDGQTAGYKQYTLLMLKSVINPSDGPIPYAETYNNSTSYQNSKVRSVINAWYQYTNMPTIKSLALEPQLTASGPNTTNGVKAGTKTTDIAFCPFKSDVYPALSTGKLMNGYRWWTQTKIVISGGWEGHFEVLLDSGVWGYSYYSDTYGPLGCYARPLVFVERPS